MATEPCADSPTSTEVDYRNPTISIRNGSKSSLSTRTLPAANAEQPRTLLDEYSPSVSRPTLNPTASSAWVTTLPTALPETFGVDNGGTREMDQATATSGSCPMRSSRACTGSGTGERTS